MQRITFSCPVCGYDNLSHPPRDYMICPCCGTEFGNDDFELSHNELRKEWILDGARWFSDHTPPPPGWNPTTQLIKAGLAKGEFQSASSGSESTRSRHRQFPHLRI